VTIDQPQRPRRRTLWAMVWSIWLAIVAVTFAVLEAVALIRRGRGDTLSENLRSWLGTDRTWKTWGAFGFVVALIGFVVWFLPHIVFKTW
jgi:hypothetical protein